MPPYDAQIVITELLEAELARDFIKLRIRRRNGCGELHHGVIYVCLIEEYGCRAKARQNLILVLIRVRWADPVTRWSCRDDLSSRSLELQSVRACSQHADCNCSGG